MIMQRKAARVLPGSTPEEKLGSLGIAPGKTIDVRTLGRHANTHNIEITLFFEEDLARTRTLDSVRQEFGHFPEYERPYVEVNSFLQFTRENDPSFEATMEEFPLMIEIVTVGDMPSGAGHPSRLFATGIMPFLDDFDVNAPPPEPNVR
jgi:hypothetical protein